MHELGIADAILKTVERVAKEENLIEVKKITLEIGDLSGVVPRFMYDCWEAVADKTPYQNAELVIKRIPGTLRCEDCGEEFTANLEKLYCPYCEGRKLTPLTGRDLTIAEIEAE